MLGDDELSPKELIDGEEKTFREGKVQFSASPSCLKEMWVGSAGEAWRLMLQKGALTAFPLVVVLLGGPIGLGCHFCYLILCMWTRLIQRAGGWRVCLSAGQQQKRQKRKQECHSPNFEQINFFFFSKLDFVQVNATEIKFRFVVDMLLLFYKALISWSNHLQHFIKLNQMHFIGL